MDPAACDLERSVQCFLRSCPRVPPPHADGGGHSRLLNALPPSFASSACWALPFGAGWPAGPSRAGGGSLSATSQPRTRRWGRAREAAPHRRLLAAAGRAGRDGTAPGRAPPLPGAGRAPSRPAAPPAVPTRHAVRAPALARRVLVAAEEREDGPPVVALRRLHELGVPADLLLLPAHGSGGKGGLRPGPRRVPYFRTAPAASRRPLRRRLLGAGLNGGPVGLGPPSAAAGRALRARRAAGRRLSPTGLFGRRAPVGGGWREVVAHGSPRRGPRRDRGRAGAGEGRGPEVPRRGKVCS